MGAAIGASLPVAIGIALSPIPIIAVVLMLTSERGRRNGPAFVAGWLAGLAVVGTIVLVIADPAGAAEPDAAANWPGWVKLGLGVLLLAVAARQFRGRVGGSHRQSMPKWMARVDGIKPAGAAGLAALLSGANPKNLLLAVAGATAVAQAGGSAGQQAIGYAVFAVIGTLGVAVPAGLYFALGDRSVRLLDRLKDWMTRHNAVIMAVLCLVIAAKLIGDAIVTLS